MDGFVSSLLASVLLASIPLIVAGMGELLAEKSGVLNLGVEGMMLLGAVSAFAVALNTGNASLGMLAGTLVGGFAAFIDQSNRNWLGTDHSWHRFIGIVWREIRWFIGDGFRACGDSIFVRTAFGGRII